MAHMMEKNRDITHIQYLERVGFSSVDPDESNWKYGQIYYNLDNGLEKKDRKKIIAVYAHEIGHCFGLDENNTNKKSIMCQAAYGRSVTSVQSCDFEGIKKLYK